jgi:hypothetical protein
MARGARYLKSGLIRSLVHQPLASDATDSRKRAVYIAVSERDGVIVAVIELSTPDPGACGARRQSDWAPCFSATITVLF